MKFLKSRGLTEVYVNRHTNNVEIHHFGNMGSSEKHNVKPDVDAMFGVGTYDALRPLGVAEGSPDYSFCLTIPWTSDVAKISGILADMVGLLSADPA